MSNSIDFYKGIFLYVIPVQILVPSLERIAIIILIFVKKNCKNFFFIADTCKSKKKKKNCSYFHYLNVNIRSLEVT